MVKRGSKKRGSKDFPNLREIEGVAETGKAKTHDTSLARYHIRNLKSFAETLNNAATSAYPNRGKSRYTGVQVLLLSWVDDNLGVKKEVNELEKVFRQIYNFGTEIWDIPSGTKSHHSLAGKLWRFIEDYDDKDRLLIVYYGGHGGMNDDRQCVWSSTDESECSTVRWSGLQTELEEARSDVLILLDCCAAASSAANTESGITEVIVACGFETTAPGVGENSFTRSLIDELKHLSNGPAFSAAVLHNKILSRIKSLKPIRVNPRTGLPIEKRKTPVYIMLSNVSNRRSIELTPMELRSSPAPQMTQEFSNLSIFSKASTVEGVEIPTRDPSEQELRPNPRCDDPKVMISVALEEDQVLDVAEWMTWLTSIPSFATYAHIEGVYRSDSTLLLLTLPVAVWDLLPENPAISFIAFTRSHNLLETQTTRDADANEKLKNPPITPTLTGQNSPPFGKDGYVLLTPPELQQLEIKNPPKLSRRWADVAAAAATTTQPSVLDDPFKTEAPHRRRSQSHISGSSRLQTSPNPPSYFSLPKAHHLRWGNSRTRRPSPHSRSSSICSREPGRPVKASPPFSPKSIK